MKKITVGIIANSRETAELLRTQTLQTGMAPVVIKSEESPWTGSDRLGRQLVEANPEVILVEIRDSAAAMRTLPALHSALPNARLLVTSHITDPQLIMDAMRSGAREFLPHPVSSSALLQAFGRYFAEEERAAGHSRPKRGKLYCVTSAKHGSGATTLAVNLAGVIASRSKQRVAFVDMDQPVGDAAAYLNVKPTFTISDAVSAGPRLDSVLLESYMSTTNGFHFLAGFREYSSNTSIPAEKLAQLLDVVQNSFDHTIVDLPTTLDEDQVQVISRASDAILVVLTPELPSIWRAERLISYLAKLDAVDKARVILNRSTRSDEIADQDIARLLRREVYCKLPNEYTACIKAINTGHLLDAVSGKRLLQAMHGLASDLAGLPEPAARRGLFGMFLKPSPTGGTI